MAVKGMPRTPGSGRKRGTKNKSTLSKLEQIKEACLMIANANGSKVFEGDAQALLTAIYKCESFPLDVRMKAAELANTRERPALQAVDSNVREQIQYVVEMPPQILDLDEWKRLHGGPPQSTNQIEWDSRVQRVLDDVRKKDGDDVGH